jgi:chaperone BCS1
MTVLSDFVEDCRLRYLESNRPRVIIHLSDAGMMSPAGEWGNVKTKTRRPLSTLALEEGVMDSLIQDVREFMDVEEWYCEAGIPHHRGYLLHGPPGTGKSESNGLCRIFGTDSSTASTIYALAGELGLEIYSLSLAAS